MDKDDKEIKEILDSNMILECFMKVVECSWFSVPIMPIYKELQLIKLP